MRIWYTVPMALTKDDLQAIRGVVKEGVHGLESRLATQMDKRFLAQTKLISQKFAEQNRLLGRNFEDLKDVMQRTYVSREEFEEKYTELQDEVDELKKELHALKRRIVPS